MTLPTLINKTRNKELHTAFLQTYSELNQIALKFKADYGISVAEYSQSKNPSHIANVISGYYKGNSSSLGSSQGTNDGEGNFIPWYSIHNLNGAGFSGGNNSSGANSSFLCDITAFKSNQSGALFILNDVPGEEKNGPVICVDINGQKAPNRYGIDYFMFIFTIDGNVIPMGAAHKYNANACTSSSGSCGNFANIGSQYCDNKSPNIAKNTSCAYYALRNTHPTKEGKDYWSDFLGEVYSR